MNKISDRVARFGLLAALALVLGYFDRAIPLSALLGGAVPGIKLGLANTVLLYAVCLMDWKSSLLLMLTKVLLSGFMFGSLNAMIYSLSGGLLSLLVMLLVRRNPAGGALSISVIAAACAAWLWSRHPALWGPRFWSALLISLAALGSLAAFFLMRRFPDYGILGVSVSGAVAHNLGQILAAAAILRTPQLLYTYLPILAGIGAAVGFLTGFIARLVLRALNRQPGRK